MLIIFHQYNILKNSFFSFVLFELFIYFPSVPVYFLFLKLKLELLSLRNISLSHPIVKGH